MELKLEEFAGQVVRSWEKNINPESLEEYYKNTLDVMLDKMVEAECYTRISTTLDAALLARKSDIKKIAEKIMDRWISDAILSDQEMPDIVSKEILKQVRSISGKLGEHVQARLIAVRRMKNGGMTEKEISSINGITVTAVTALLEKAEEQISDLKKTLADYG